MNEFELLFSALNIEIKDLPNNYTPDEYGKQLINDSCFETEIVYSVSTQTNANTDSDKKELALQY